MKFVSATKKSDELIILMKVWPGKITKEVKQRGLIQTLVTAFPKIKVQMSSLGI